MTFPSGLSVLHTPYYHPKIFSDRLVNTLTPRDSDSSNMSQEDYERSYSTMEIALTEGLSVGLGRELVGLVEMQYGSVVRDEQSGGGGERWFRNLISEWAIYEERVLARGDKVAY